MNRSLPVEKYYSQAEQNIIFNYLYKEQYIITQCEKYFKITHFDVTKGPDSSIKSFYNYVASGDTSKLLNWCIDIKNGIVVIAEDNSNFLSYTIIAPCRFGKTSPLDICSFKFFNTELNNQYVSSERRIHTNKLLDYNDLYSFTLLNTVKITEPWQLNRIVNLSTSNQCLDQTPLFLALCVSNASNYLLSMTMYQCSNLNPFGEPYILDYTSLHIIGSEWKLETLVINQKSYEHVFLMWIPGKSLASIVTFSIQTQKWTDCGICYLNMNNSTKTIKHITSLPNTSEVYTNVISCNGNVVCQWDTLDIDIFSIKKKSDDQYHIVHIRYINSVNSLVEIPSPNSIFIKCISESLIVQCFESLVPNEIVMNIQHVIHGDSQFNPEKSSLYVSEYPPFHIIRKPPNLIYLNVFLLNETIVIVLSTSDEVSYLQVNSVSYAKPQISAPVILSDIFTKPLKDKFLNDFDLNESTLIDISLWLTGPNTKNSLPINLEKNICALIYNGYLTCNIDLIQKLVNNDFQEGIRAVIASPLASEESLAYLVCTFPLNFLEDIIQYHWGDRSEMVKYLRQNLNLPSLNQIMDKIKNWVIILTTLPPVITNQYNIPPLDKICDFLCLLIDAKINDCMVVFDPYLLDLAIDISHHLVNMILIRKCVDKLHGQVSFLNHYHISNLYKTQNTDLIETIQINL